MKQGDLVETIVEEQLVILIRKVASKVWEVLTPEGEIKSEWVLNLQPYEEKI